MSLCLPIIQRLFCVLLACSALTANVCGGGSQEACTSDTQTSSSLLQIRSHAFDSVWLADWATARNASSKLLFGSANAAAIGRAFAEGDWQHFWMQAVLSAVCLIVLAGMLWVGTNNAQKDVIARLFDKLDAAFNNVESKSKNGQSTAWMIRQNSFLIDWEEEHHLGHIKKGAAMMFVGSLILLCYRVLRLVSFPDCMPKPHYLRVSELIAVSLVAVNLAICIKFPNDKVFWCAYVLMGFYALASTLPPFQWSCSELEEHCGQEESLYIKEAVEQFDCSLQGQTATLLFMTCLFASPWIIPEFRSMHVLWVHGAAYVIWSVLLAWIDGEGYHRAAEVLVRGALLMFNFFEAMYFKLQMERNEQRRYSNICGLRQDVKRMYVALANMLPEHVIKPQLQKPDDIFSSEIERASILFVEVHDFDEVSKECFSSPQEIVKFLHKLFRIFDKICESKGVTKIESIREQYVCCVGVTPEDEAENGDHSVILGRLISAAEEMLKQQTSKLRFQMGINTGKITAGIVGKRLPRFRLTGDTMNVASRIMHIPPVGRLAFGEATRSCLPPSAEWEDYGKHDLKGKGEVQIYLLGMKDRSGQGTTPNLQTTTSEFLERKFDDDEDEDAEGPLHQLLKFEKMHSETPTATSNALAATAIEAWKLPKDAEEVINEAAETFAQHGSNREMEDEWYHFFHKNSLGPGCSRIIKRFNMMALWVVLLTAVDLLFLVTGGARLLHMDHEFFSWRWRVPIFTSCRIAAVATLQGVRLASGQQWFSNQPSAGQWYIIMSLVVVAVLIFISYDALTESRAAVAELEQELGKQGTLAGHVSAYEEVMKNVQFFPLLFVLFFFRLMRVHTPIFSHSLIFLPLAIGITLYTTWSPASRLYLTWWGSNLFAVNALLTCMHAREEEKISRTEFASQRSILEMQEKVSKMTNSLLPRLVVEDFRKNGGNLYDMTHPYKHATIAQSDLAGFTELASKLEPGKTLDFIRDLFGRFDGKADEYGIYKVETIGDAYVAGMAEKPLTEERSASRVVIFGISMVRIVAEWSKDKGLNLKCRVGVHDGECIGGIVGIKMQRYHVFGELMTVVEKLEATAPVAGVQVSSACKSAVDHELATGVVPLEHFSFQKRNLPVLMTSKNKEHTYEEVGGPTFVILGPTGIVGDADTADVPPRGETSPPEPPTNADNADNAGPDSSPVEPPP